VVLNFTFGIRVMGDESTAKKSQNLVIRSGSVPIQYPMLNDMNYGLWAVKMKIVLKALGV
jgi:hypothetical protein